MARPGDAPRSAAGVHWHLEVLHTLTPEPAGTRLGLTYRWPARTPRKSREALARLMAGDARATVTGYRDLIEGGRRRQ